MMYPFPVQPFQPMSPISNARDTVSLNSLSDVPQLTDSVLSYFQAILVSKAVKKNIAGRLVESFISIGTRGCFQQMKQPLKPREDGQRLWRRGTLFTIPGVDIKEDDVIKIKNVPYRVMLVSDYSQNGYMQFGLIEAPKTPGA